MTVTGRGGIQSCETLRIPQCLDNRLKDGDEVVSRMHQSWSTPPQNKFYFCLWYSVLLEADLVQPEGLGKLITFN
jgi:hypothetical protein